MNEPRPVAGRRDRSNQAWASSLAPNVVINVSCRRPESRIHPSRFDRTVKAATLCIRSGGTPIVRQIRPPECRTTEPVGRIRGAHNAIGDLNYTDEMKGRNQMSRGQCLGASMLALVLSGGSFAMSDEPKQQAARPSRQYTIEQFLATTTISGPTLSPDGSKVAFTSDASGIPNVYSVSFTGGAIAPLTKSTTDSTYSVSYFPRDERLLFTHDKGGDEQNHLFVLDKGAETDITPGKSLKAAFANWTTDDLAFFTLSNERDPRFFDVYRHVTADYKRSLVYENKSGSMPSAVSGDGAGWRSTSPGRRLTATSRSGMHQLKKQL